MISERPTEPAPCGLITKQPADFSNMFVSVAGYLDLLGAKRFPRPARVPSFGEAQS